MSLLALTLTAFVAPSLSTQAQETLQSAVAEVTVFSGGGALVMRRAEAPRGRGAFVVPGLPWSADPESVRVRAQGAAVVGVEVKERHLPSVPSERIEELRGRLKGVMREQQALADEGSVLQSIGKHLERLLQLEAQQHNEEVQSGRPDVAAWQANLSFLRDELQRNRTDQRELGWRAEDLERTRRDLEAQLGRFESGTVDQREVHVQLEGGEGAAALEVEYRVGDAGWRPAYDLRTAADARSVDVAYRGEVWQRTGEDWTDCSIALSTARPHVGAQGPDPEVVWLSLREPRNKRMRFGAEADAPAALAEEVALGRGDMGGFDVPLFAAVENQGLSVRFRIPRRETILSQEATTTVLVGQTELAVEPEYFATPALDENVWLRGRTTNTSEWVLLPGRAAVYFGADFIGHAELELVQPGAELTLHLGPDPALSMERSQVEDLSKKPGIFSSRVTDVERWRIELKNSGAAATQPNGAARVFVREVLPRSTDSRLEVELGKTTPNVSDGERWERERKEEGILTWVLEVPNGGAANIVWETKISYPEGTTVVR
jgi:uncharacterized protein (TIGR02231 family)